MKRWPGFELAWRELLDTSRGGELGDAAAYYAEHASRAIAEAFLTEFERVRDLLIENQRRGPHGDHGLRVYHLDRLPFTVVYEPSDELGPQIYAIAHQHRVPGYWAERIGS